MKFKMSPALLLCAFLCYPIFSFGQSWDENECLFRWIDLGSDEPVKVDVSFCIADLKFDGEDLKICEFGEGCHSKFRGFDRLYGKGKAWELFWLYLSRFKLPIWYVGAGTKSKKFYEEIAYDTFVECGGNFIGSLGQLEKNGQFLKTVGRGVPEDPSCISNYKAIICVKTFHNATRSFIRKFPNVLIWDVATSYYVNSKIRSTMLFNDSDLSRFRPNFWLLKRSLSGNISASYKDDIMAQFESFDNNGYLVIKPTCSTMGQGIMMLPKKDLQKALKSILTIRTGKVKKNRGDDSVLSYWHSRKDGYCLVEEFVKSKTIEIGGKKFDPTMRVIFALCFDQGVPSIDVFGAYWKLPPIALNESGRFTDKHKSHIRKNGPSSWPVDHQDLEKVTNIMQQFMPKVYTKMVYKTRVPDDLDTDEFLF